MDKTIRENFEHDFQELIHKIDVLNDLALYVEHKSKFINITAIRDYESIWYKHIFDSLIMTKIPQIVELLHAGASVIDIGTGGGFPGLPLALCFENSKIMLNDSTQKKLKVIDEFVEEKKLTNVTTVWGRAEELSERPRFQNSFDIVTARSVASLFRIVELCRPFIKKDGYLVLYKSVKEPELSQLEICAMKNRLRVISRYEYEILNDKRLLITLQAR